jgi:branched-chain amino acid transport system substrate-binding protein
MLRLGTLLKRTLAPAAVCALALSACGSQHKPPATTRTASGKPSAKSKQTVYIYSSLPHNGPEATASAQIESGIRLALHGTHLSVPGFRIRYEALDDSIVKRSRRGKIPVFKGTGWNPQQTLKNAERAARQPQAVAYIGDLDSGATMLSLPILNEAGIAQLTPGSGYPGLTDSYAKYGITQSGEPDKYYPQPSTRTLLRLIPNDTVQASAALQVLRAGGCQRFSAWRFAPKFGPKMLEAQALFNSVIAIAPKYHMTYKPAPALSSSTKYFSYADALKPDQLHCAVMVGTVTPAAVMLTTELRLQLVTPIVGTSGFCGSSWVRGISSYLHKNAAEVKNVVSGLYCTTPVRPVTEAQYPTTRKFVGHFISVFRHRYHRKPLAYDYYGYVAAELVIAALKDVAPNEDARQQVTSGLFGSLPSIELNTYTFDDSGDLGSSAYGVDSFVDSAGHVNAAGVPQHYKTVTPDAAHLLTSAG